MATTVEASGSQTASIGTEHTLATIAGPGAYQVWIDTTAMTATDVVEFRAKAPVLSGGTVVTFFYGMFCGAQPADDVGKISAPFMIDSAAGGCLITLKQTIGTGRSFPWKILKA